MRLYSTSVIPPFLLQHDKPSVLVWIKKTKAEAIDFSFDNHALTFPRDVCNDYLTVLKGKVESLNRPGMLVTMTHREFARKHHEWEMNSHPFFINFAILEFIVSKTPAKKIGIISAQLQTLVDCSDIKEKYLRQDMAFTHAVLLLEQLKFQVAGIQVDEDDRSAVDQFSLPSSRSRSSDEKDKNQLILSVFNGVRAHDECKDVKKKNTGL